jgi:hypothetical protein
MARVSPPSDKSEFHRKGRSWSRWSSMVRLAFWGGDARCGQCGSADVRRAWSLPSWRHAIGLDAARCESCGATFHVPRRASTAEMYEEAPDPAYQLTLPAPPEVDLDALDREMARRLAGRPKPAE